MALKLFGIQIFVHCAYRMMVIQEMHRSNLHCVYICTLKQQQKHHTFFITITQVVTSIGGLLVPGYHPTSSQCICKIYEIFYRVFDTTVRIETQITLIRHETSYKQLEVNSKWTSCFMQKSQWTSQHGTQNVTTKCWTSLCTNIQTKSTIRPESSYKQMGVKTNWRSFLCGNSNGHHSTELSR